MSSDSDSCVEEHPSIDELKAWKVVELKDWLQKHNINKLGTKSKEILMNKVYRAMSNCKSSDDSDTEDSIPTDDTEVIPPVHTLVLPWETMIHSHVPDMTLKDVDCYFRYKKNPVTGQKK